MQKRFLTLLLAVVLTVSAAGCGHRPSSSDIGGMISEDGGPTGTFVGRNAEKLQETDDGEGDMDDTPDQTTGQNPWQEFFQKTFYQVISDAGNTNRIYSPVNLYHCLAMLSEISGGESRAQITALLGQEDQKKIRRQSEKLYRKTNHVLTCRVGELDAKYDYTCSMANSLWLREGFPFREDRLRKIEDFYYAECYQGKMGTADMDKKIQRWVNKMTRGKLKEQTGSIQTNPNTIMMMLSSIYFDSAWAEVFLKEKTKAGVFHGIADTKQAASEEERTEDITCDFLHKTLVTEIMKTDRYMAVKLPMQNGAGMYIILPNEGISLADLLKKEKGRDLLPFCEGYNGDTELAEIDFSMPKFQIDSTFEMIDLLKELGVTDIFQETEADFSSLTEGKDGGETDNIYVGRVSQASNMSLDESGCSVASYTEVDLESKGAMQVPDKRYKMKCDRPFLFFITKQDTEEGEESPLFTGVIQNPKSTGK